MLKQQQQQQQNRFYNTCHLVINIVWKTKAVEETGRNGQVH